PMRASTRSEPDCTGRWSCGATVGQSAIVSMSRSPMSEGWGEVKRRRAMPGTSPVRRRSSTKSHSPPWYAFTVAPRTPTTLAPTPRHSEQLGEPPVAVRPDQQVDVGSPLRQAPAEVLRHAARDPELQVGPPPLVARQLGQAPEHARLGVLADRTGVEEDHVR